MRWLKNQFNQLIIYTPLLCTAQKIEELQEALRKKDEDMKQMEDRYKKYLEKAKSVSSIFLNLPEVICNPKK